MTSNPVRKAAIIAGSGALGAGAGYTITKSPLGTALGGMAGAAAGVLLLSDDSDEMQEAFNEGYIRATSDSIKRQYWIKQNLEKGNQDDGHVSYYSIPASTATADGRELVDHNLVISVYE